MSRCISKPPLPRIALYEIISHASHIEKHLNLGDLTRTSAMKALQVHAEAVQFIYPEAAGLWFNITKKKVYGRHLVVWGIGKQPTLKDT